MFMIICNIYGCTVGKLNTIDWTNTLITDVNYTINYQFLIFIQ